MLEALRGTTRVRLEAAGPTGFKPVVVCALQAWRPEAWRLPALAGAVSFGFQACSSDPKLAAQSSLPPEELHRHRIAQHNPAGSRFQRKKANYETLEA